MRSSRADNPTSLKPDPPGRVMGCIRRRAVACMSTYSASSSNSVFVWDACGKMSGWAHAISPRSREWPCKPWQSCRRSRHLNCWHWSRRPTSLGVGQIAINGLAELAAASFQVNTSYLCATGGVCLLISQWCWRAHHCIPCHHQAGALWWSRGGRSLAETGEGGHRHQHLGDVILAVICLPQGV